MFVCGKNYVGGKNACAFTPTSVNKITKVDLMNGIYDYLFLTQDTTLDINNELQEDWDWNTLLYAKFNNNTNAGNIDKALEETTHIVIKSRKVGDFEWQTLAVKEVNSIEDFNIYFNDYFVPSMQPTQYAIVHSYYGIERTYSVVTVTPEFNMMFLIKGDEVYGTYMTDGTCNTTRNIPSSNVETLNNKYPTFVRNGKANYDTGECNGCFMPVENEDGQCTQANFSQDGDYARIQFQKKVMDFIALNKPGILKMPDGRMWIVQVTPNPTDTAEDTYNFRSISFSWVEIGDATSESDLYYLGLTDVSPEWWSKE